MGHTRFYFIHQYEGSLRPSIQEETGGKHFNQDFIGLPMLACYANSLSGSHHKYADSPMRMDYSKWCVCIYVYVCMYMFAQNLLKLLWLVPF